MSLRSSTPSALKHRSLSEKFLFRLHCVSLTSILSHLDDPPHLPPVSQTKHDQIQQWKLKDIFSFTHNHLVGGDVGVAEAGDVGLAGLDVDLVLVHLANLAILGVCLLAFLPETLKAFYPIIIKRKKKPC